MNIGAATASPYARFGMPPQRTTGGGSPAEQDSTGRQAPAQAAAGTLAQAESGQPGAGQAVGRKEECQTCENRTYQDGSNDPGVSFKTPSKIRPGSEASAVMSHEREHVTRNQAKARREGREVVSQSVTLHSGVCGECGRVFVAGGTTRTVTRGKPDADRFSVGLEPPAPAEGQSLNKAV